MGMLTTIDLNLIEYTSKYTGETDFQQEEALALLLLNQVVFLNSYWWEEDQPEEKRERISVSVECNDVFASGCADSEELPYEEIENLYKMYIKDPIWGTAIWCIQRRKQMPQKPVEKLIRKAGIWDLDSMGIAENTMDLEITN